MNHKNAEVEGADLILKNCGGLKADETITIVCDPTTKDCGDLLAARARLISNSVKLVVVPELAMHGQEPTVEAAQAMLDSALCLGITAKSMAHTRARQKASAKGTRYLSLPEYSMALFADACLRADYEVRGLMAKRVADRFTSGSKVTVTSAAGTNITMRINDRVGNCCPGFVRKAGDLGSPPDIEANVSPIEDSAEGVVVVDGAIPYPGLGLLSEPVGLEVRSGKIVKVDANEKIKKALDRLFASAGSAKAFVLAECGVGLNDLAQLTGIMLTDEGAAGTMHFGFGSNSTVGGLNEVAFHLDFVFRNPTLVVDEIKILHEGEYVLQSESHKIGK